MLESGAHPIIDLNKPEYNLRNDDIDKSKPNFIKFQTTRQASNPLNPVYKLPEVEYLPPEPPKFIRDNISNEDIDGAKPKKARYFETRDIMQINDIDGTKGKKTYVRATPYDNFNYADITKTKFVTQRSTNPLNPSYKSRDEDGKLIEIGQIKGSQPRLLPFRNNAASYSQLNTADIAGALTGSKTLGNFHTTQRT